MRNMATGARMAVKTTAVTSVTTGTGDKNTDETRKGKGKGNGGNGELFAEKENSWEKEQ